MNRDEEVLLRVQDVINRTGLSRATIYEKMARGAFPPSVKIGKRAVAWRSSDISAGIKSLSPASDEKDKGVRR